MRIPSLNARLVFLLTVVSTGCSQGSSSGKSDKDIEAGLSSMIDELDEIAERLGRVSTPDQEEAVFSDLMRCTKQYEERLFSVDDGPAFGTGIEVRERDSDHPVTSDFDAVDGEVDVIVTIHAHNAAGEPEVVWERRIECLSK